MAPPLLQEINAAKRSEWMQKSVIFLRFNQTRVIKNRTNKGRGDRMPGVPNLGPFDKETGYVNAIIETPKGSRNKFKFDERLRLFRLGGALPPGAVFRSTLATFPRREGTTEIRSMY